MHRLHWIISLTTCLNTTDGMIFFFKLQSTFRPVLLYKSTRKLSNLYVHVQHNINSVSITRSGVASCMLSYTWHRYTLLLICLYKHRQTITLHPRLFNVYMFTYLVYLTTIIILFVQSFILWVIVFHARNKVIWSWSYLNWNAFHCLKLV